MARLIIENIDTDYDLIALAHHLLDAAVSGRSEEFTFDGTLTLTTGDARYAADRVAELVWMDDDYNCSDSSHRAECSCRRDAAMTDPRQGLLLDTARHSGPVPYVRCPKAGTHDKLTDCWMCWSDVQRGAMAMAQATTTSRAAA